jgi:hypothetical protein
VLVVCANQGSKLMLAACYQSLEDIDHFLLSAETWGQLWTQWARYAVKINGRELGMHI